MASDKLFGTEPSKKIKDSFPSSCLPINLPLFRLASSGGFVLICSVWNCRVTHKVITTSRRFFTISGGLCLQVMSPLHSKTSNH